MGIYMKIPDSWQLFCGENDYLSCFSAILNAYTGSFILSQQFLKIQQLKLSVNFTQIVYDRSQLFNRDLQSPCPIVHIFKFSHVSNCRLNLYSSHFHSQKLNVILAKTQLLYYLVLLLLNNYAQRVPLLIISSGCEENAKLKTASVCGHFFVIAKLFLL